MLHKNAKKWYRRILGWLPTADKGLRRSRTRKQGRESNYSPTEKKKVFIDILANIHQQKKESIHRYFCKNIYKNQIVSDFFSQGKTSSNLHIYQRIPF